MCRQYFIYFVIGNYFFGSLRPQGTWILGACSSSSS